MNESDLSPEQTVIFEEGQKATDFLKRACKLGEKLKDTGLTRQEAEVTPEDVETLRSVLHTLQPPNKEYERLYIHLETSAAIARILAVIMGYNPNKHEALALLHDAGRLITHRLYRTNLLNGVLEKALGIREDLSNTLIPTAFEMGPKMRYTLEDFTPEQLLQLIADNAGKRPNSQQPNEILLWKDIPGWVRGYMRDYSQATGLPPVWPSERKALANNTAEFIEENIKFVQQVGAYFREKYSITIDNVQQEVMDMERQSLKHRHGGK